MANEGGIRAGKAYVELYADNSKLVQGMKAAEGKLKAFGANVTAIGKWAFAGGMGAATLWATTAKEIGRASQRTGMTTEMFSGLAYAAKKSGLDVEAFEGGIRKMQKTLFAAAEGGAADVKVIEDLGLSVAGLMAMSPDQQLGAFADSIGKIKDPTIQAGMAMEVFGKTGTMMIPFLERGSAGLKKMAGEAKDAGQIFSAQDVAAAKEFNSALGMVISQGKALMFAIGSAVAPVLAELLKQFGAGVKIVVEWVKAHQDAVVWVLKVGVGALVLGKAIGVVTAVAGGARVAMIALSAHPLVAMFSAVAAASMLAADAIDRQTAAVQRLKKEASDAKEDKEARGMSGAFKKAAAEMDAAGIAKNERRKADLAKMMEDTRVARGERSIEDQARFDKLRLQLSGEDWNIYLGSIRDKYEQERILAKRHYEQMEQDLKRANELRFLRGEKPDAQSKAMIDETRKAKLAQIDEAEQLEKNAATKQRRAAAAEQRDEMQWDIRRLTIETGPGSQQEKDRRLLALQHERERADFFNKPFGAGDEELLFKRQALQQRLALMSQVPRQSSVGTFNPTMVGRMGGGNQLDRIAKATEASKKTLDEINKKPAAKLAFK
jgi:hypothetical protein